MIERKYMCSISYDGSSYKGLVKQPNEITILGEMEKHFLKCFKETISIIPSGRTDSGVHAKDQRIQFTSIIPKERILKWWNISLPRDIFIKNCKEIKEENFHVRFSVVEKKYSYYLSTSKETPFQTRYKHFIKNNVDFELLEKTLKMFIGSHDFSSVSKFEKDQNPVRTIRNITAIKRGRNIKISFFGQSFLRYMVRRMVGTSLSVATRTENYEDTLKKFTEKEQIKYSVPSCGLFLEKISFKELIK